MRDRLASCNGTQTEALGGSRRSQFLLGDGLQTQRVPGWGSVPSPQEMVLRKFCQGPLPGKKADDG